MDLCKSQIWLFLFWHCLMLEQQLTNGQTSKQISETFLFSFIYRNNHWLHSILIFKSFNW
jgi:hypothetical protein